MQPPMDKSLPRNSSRRSTSTSRPSTQVDRIAGYLRWQESIASICGAEAERLSARKKSAEGRVSRLKNMLLHFMLRRGLKKLDGEARGNRASAELGGFAGRGRSAQDRRVLLRAIHRLHEDRNAGADLPIAGRGPKGRLEAQLAEDGWQVNGSAIRAAIVNGSEVAGARLVKGHHIRIRLGNSLAPTDWSADNSGERGCRCTLQESRSHSDCSGSCGVSGEN